MAVCPYEHGRPSRDGDLYTGTRSRCLVSSVYVDSPLVSAIQFTTPTNNNTSSVDFDETCTADSIISGRRDRFGTCFV